jgi:hypothetical protein
VAGSQRELISNEESELDATWLTSDSCYVFDCVTQIYVWFGKCKKKVRVQIFIFLVSNEGDKTAAAAYANVRKK